LNNPTTSITNEPESTITEVTFEQLPEALRAAAARAGWTTLMPVQARAIPYLLAERDMMIQARTGSGKTGAFLLPMIERLDPARNQCQALILVPTRELAHQVWQAAETVCATSGLRTVAVYGGVGYGAQSEALRQGAHIVIGTPGRVLDHLLKRTFSLEHLEMLVFDEADRMLSMGFYPDMKQMQRYLPDRDLHTCMFSATFPPYVLRTAREFIREPEFLTLSSDHVHVTDTEHLFYMVPAMGRERSLVRLIEIENPASAIIFCNTKVEVHFVTIVLQRFGYDADELSADLAQKDRERVLTRVRQGTLRFLVATDVAARGLDIPDLSHVIQYEPPEDPESYIHRAGRTGRAGASGTAITLTGSVMEKLALDRIAKHYKINLQERTLPTEADVEAVVAERVTALLEARLRERDKLQSERSRRFIPLARSLAENEDESAIMAMLLDDYYQQMLHAPVAQPDDTPAANAPSQSQPGRSRRRRRSGGRR
jgi:ATP-dependent RNA helicase DeaD